MYVRVQSGVWKNGEKGGGGQKMVGRKMDSRVGSLCLLVTMHAWGLEWRKEWLENGFELLKLKIENFTRQSGSPNIFRIT